MTHEPLLDACADVLERLGRANQGFATRYPGDRPDRQPIHTVYGGAHLFKAETAGKLGELAIRSLDAYAPDAFTLGRALGLWRGDDADTAELTRRYDADPDGLRRDDPDAWLTLAVYSRVRRRLEREAVEDFRIDFEDGFGNRPDPEEDETAIRAAKEVARGMKEGSLPPFIGIRIKPLNDELKRRSVRTLDLFVTTLVAEGGGLPPNFVVTLPKVPIPEQVETLVQLFEALEARTGLEKGALKLELMIELTQSIIDHEGRSNLPRLLAAAEGRCVAAHFGTYDYTASCNITAAYQKIDHPACDFALHMMKVAFAGTGVWLSDGATVVMPVGPHRTPKGGALSPAQERENAEAVHAAWKMSYDHIWHALKNGFYQGWDLHPAQLPIRYAACYAFFLQGFAPAAERLANFIDKAAQATLVGDVFDDAATGQGLLNYFLRGLNSGAVSLEELAVTGLTVEEIQTRSFVKILAMRSR
jgi:citrate lyase beta subunit